MKAPASRENKIRQAAEAFLSAVERARRRTFALDELEAHVQAALGPEAYVEAGEYQALAAVVQALVDEDRIAPIRARGPNGRNPPLYRGYRLAPARPPEAPAADLVGLHPRIDRTGLRRLGGQDAGPVRAVSEYLFAHPGRSDRPAVPRNERSLEIFGDEKFLERRPGFLRALGLELADIHTLEVREPFFHRRFDPPGPVALILENLATFWSVCRVLESEAAWRWGPRPALVIYGEGKKILRSIGFLEVFPEVERVAYFGDLDPEGVGILAGLREREPRCVPAEPLYRGLLRQQRRARPLKRAPGRVDGKEAFAGCGDLAERVEDLFARGLWLPQEALGLEAILGDVPGKPCQAPSGASRD